MSRLGHRWPAGLLLGLASAMFILVNGRILGISGSWAACSAQKAAMWHQF